MEEGRQDEWNHYFELIEQGKLPSETDGIGLEDYYEYMQARCHTRALARTRARVLVRCCQRLPNRGIILHAERMIVLPRRMHLSAQSHVCGRFSTKSCWRRPNTAMRAESDASSRWAQT